MLLFCMTEIFSLLVDIRQATPTFTELNHKREQRYFFKHIFPIVSYCSYWERLSLCQHVYQELVNFVAFWAAWQAERTTNGASDKALLIFLPLLLCIQPLLFLFVCLVGLFVFCLQKHLENVENSSKLFNLLWIPQSVSVTSQWGCTRPPFFYRSNVMTHAFFPSHSQTPHPLDLREKLVYCL